MRFEKKKKFYREEWEDAFWRKRGNQTSKAKTNDEVIATSESRRKEDASAMMDGYMILL